MQSLPQLLYEDLLPTRNYLQNICLVLGEVQRQFLSANDHEWQYGLEVNMRGISTQEFLVDGTPTRILFDLVRHKVRIGETSWPIEEYAAPEIYKNFKVWFSSRGVLPTFLEPTYVPDANNFSLKHADSYALALWWMHRQFAALKASRSQGLTSPLLLYPHHFDLSLVWFPDDTQKQMALGFSTGDEVIAEPYIYFTAYPEPTGFTAAQLPKQAYWQTNGFSGAILPYASLQEHTDPAALLRTFAQSLYEQAPLLTN